MEKNSKIMVLGHRGMVGSAVYNLLRSMKYTNVMVLDKKIADLTVFKEVSSAFSVLKPEYVILAAAKVGGIYANESFGGDFIRDNILISTNVIECCRIHKVKKLAYLGSSCIYPREAAQPIKESELLTGPLEETNIGYAIAKIAGIKMCQLYHKQHGCNFISLMPTNLYGENDNFDPYHSHVIPGMMNKFHSAKVKKEEFVELWGDGTPRREFLHVNDLADAIVFLMNNYDDPEIINVGTGEDIALNELAVIMKDTVKFNGEIRWNTNFKNGTPRKLLDVSKLHSLGWRHKTELAEGIKNTYDWYINNYYILRKK